MVIPSKLPAALPWMIRSRSTWVSQLAKVKRCSPSGKRRIDACCGGRSIRDLAYLSASGEERLSHLDVARHCDLRVTPQRFIEQRLCFFGITFSGAINKHHGVEAAYLRLFEAIGKGFGLLHRDLKMLFAGLPLARRGRSDTCDRLGEAGDRPKQYRSSVDEFANKWVKLFSSRSFT